ncbi:Transmembrane protein TauE-like [Caulobacteraceae bacterium]
MDPGFRVFFAAGVAAQLVDGAPGMAFGVVSSTVLLALGVPPANASASVHAAKVFTGAASAVSHIAYRDFNGRLLLHLAAGGGGWMTRALPVRALTWLVGLLVTGLAIWQGAVLAGLS